MKKNGTILIVTLWILAILSLLAVGAGFRMGLEIKLTGFRLSELKALYLAKAGINKAIALRWMEQLRGKSRGVDALSQVWSNNKDMFHKIELGEGSFTLSHCPKELDRSDKEIILYGMEDEYSRININRDDILDSLRILFVDKGLELESARALASSIKDWRDKDNIPSNGGAEEAYYQSLEKPYHSSDADFKAIEELLLVKGMTRELFYGEDKNKDGKIALGEEGIEGFLTVFGDKKININTAPEPVLKTVFGLGFSDLAKKIMDYRRGFDGKIGTSDDRWFGSGNITVHRKGLGMVQIKNLNDKAWSGNIFGVTKREWGRIKKLSEEGSLATTTNVFRINATGQVRKVKKDVVAVVKFEDSKPLTAFTFKKSPPPPDIEYLYWYED